ncbi:response regulator [Pseudoalteromonas piscicida]|uniref:Transcriptional regulatory protein n=1 Tax=Pseudoalteromonas piscicida TaxID=43662 RepID=A0ABM6NHE9_PSEO7|nr:response regulator [Pseudoalteromonas piscicida]ATD08216.1 two-component system, CitB family, response regulator [Pseudoalteromonas piscicida]WPU30271.1 response regulator [Pseudoalteromonas piscicida]
MTYSVVIIEDEVAVAQLLAQYLVTPTTPSSARQGQYRVVASSDNVSTATVLLSAIQADLILLDIYLPDGNGLEFLKMLREQGCKSEVMLITAAKEVATLEKAIRLGVCDFLVKPLILERLDLALARFEARQQCLDGANEVTQSMVDTLFGSEQASVPSTARLPKGVDPLTLEKIRTAFQSQPKQVFTATQMGELVGVSRSTARRYLEFLVSIEEVKADQSYGSIGRPERSYHLN